MTVYEFARICMDDNEFNRGGIVKNERKCLDAVGFEYTMKYGTVWNTGEDAKRFYAVMETLRELNSEYIKHENEYYKEACT